MSGEETKGTGGKGRTIGAIVLGVLLILVLTPLSQFLTLGLNNSDLETATPVGWAVGLVVSLVLVVAVVRLISKRRIVSKANLVLLYCMLTIAVPLMNMGLVRALFVAIRAAQQHYVNYGTNTYRTAHQSEKPAWFPVVPTMEGLAWNKAQRLLRILEDSRKVKVREDARREVVLAISLEARRLGKGGDGAAEADPQAAAKIREKIKLLGVDGAEAVLKQAEAVGGQTNVFRDAVTRLGVGPDLERQIAESRQASAAAAGRLMAVLSRFDEHEACYVPAVVSKRPPSERGRFEKDRDRLTAEERADLEQRVKALEGEFDVLRQDVSLLSRADFAKVRNRRAEQFRAEYARMDEARLARIRTGFVYRSSVQERREMFAQNGQDGTPNQNVAGLEVSLWATPESRAAVANATMWAKIREVWRNTPWKVWLQPMVRWSLLIASIFLLLTCVAEWLRRKWVDRENLAFPLVEVADNIIRHDYALESASDPTQPEPRRRMFSLAFWIGCLAATVILSVEALGNYNILPDVKILQFNVSERLFTSESFRELDKVFFLLSPIAVGILFLVSLEISFSVWVLYFLYRFAFVIAKKSAGGDIRDSVYTGWGGGMNYPFEMEQLLGASLCFAAVILFKTWHTMRKEGPGHVSAGGAYVTPKLNRAGMILLPLVIGFLLWDLGVTNIPFMIVIGVIAAGLAIAGARVRAETGLPTQHVTYEFTKLPLVFGLTGMTGAKVYTVFISLAFLPVTLLFRMLPQQLENIELARRNRVKYGTVAAASLIAFFVALGAGLVSFLIFAYYQGQAAWGGGCAHQGQGYNSVFSYPLWVSHFLGESGLETFTHVHEIRVWFIAIGAGIFGVLLFLRGRVMGFPFHPIAYLLILMSVYFPWIVPYYKSPMPAGESETSWLWGSALVAWLIKKLIVKYGGMNTYKRAKPFFIGLVVGSVLCVFVWNVVDLAGSMAGANLEPGVEPGDFLKTFMDRPPFNPRGY